MIEITVSVLCIGFIYLLYLVNKLNNQLNDIIFKVGILALYLTKEIEIKNKAKKEEENKLNKENV